MQETGSRKTIVLLLEISDFLIIIKDLWKIKALYSIIFLEKLLELNKIE